jgi:molybdopterin synthase sulfur carrier subunit
MATVFIPALFRQMTGGATKVDVPGSTLRQVLDNLEGLHPGIRERVVDDAGFRPEVFVAINGEEGLGLDAPVGETAEVYILPAIAGGA